MPEETEDIESTMPHRQNSPVALFDALEPGFDSGPEAPAAHPAPEPQHATDEPPRATAEPARAAVEPSRAPAEPSRAAAESGRRKGRTSMPSWDEIVFGARTEE